MCVCVWVCVVYCCKLQCYRYKDVLRACIGVDPRVSTGQGKQLDCRQVGVFGLYHRAVTVTTLT